MTLVALPLVAESLKVAASDVGRIVNFNDRKARQRKASRLRRC